MTKRGGRVVLGMLIISRGLFVWLSCVGPSACSIRRLVTSYTPAASGYPIVANLVLPWLSPRVARLDGRVGSPCRVTSGPAGPADGFGR